MSDSAKAKYSTEKITTVKKFYDTGHLTTLCSGGSNWQLILLPDYVDFLKI